MELQQSRRPQFPQLPQSAPRIDAPFLTRPPNARLPLPILATSTAAGSRRARPRAKTSSERGRFFRQRQKEYEDKLMRDIGRLRSEVARLSFSKCVWNEKFLLQRTNHWGSLARLSRDLYTVLKHGLERVDRAHSDTCFERRQAAEQAAARMEYKKNFLRRVVHPDVVYGNLVGVDALIEQWQIHTMAYAHFELEVGTIESITGSEESPIVVLRTKLHAWISHETFPIMFPFVQPYRREDLMEMVVNRDVSFNCVTRFQFSEDGRIINYGVEIDFAEALIQIMGDVRRVAELTRLSVISPDATLPAPEATFHGELIRKVEPTNGSWDELEHQADAACVYNSRLYHLRVWDWGGRQGNENPNYRYDRQDYEDYVGERPYDNERSRFNRLITRAHKDEGGEHQQIV